MPGQWKVKREWKVKSEEFECRGKWKVKREWKVKSEEGRVKNSSAGASGK